MKYMFSLLLLPSTIHYLHKSGNIFDNLLMPCNLIFIILSKPQCFKYYCIYFTYSRGQNWDSESKS